MPQFSSFSSPKTPLSPVELLERLRCEGTLLMTVPVPGSGSDWKLFCNPVEILQADSLEEVKPLLNQLERLSEQGFYTAGFLAYEAGNALDSELHALFAEGFPLLQFAVFEREPESIEIPEFRDCPPLEECIPELSQEEYFANFSEIKDHIIAGNIYQANLTFRASFAEKVSPEELFLSLYTRHPVPYAAFLNFGTRKIASLSPELFLESDGQQLFSIPMKGTAKRLPEAAADHKLAEWLMYDIKNRAENLMITDMVRNDFGRICRPGSIVVDPLFHVDTYRTVHQMVSKVRGELRDDVGLCEVMQAMFPPASITGAPKISAVNLIAQNEKSPRKIYTGSIGCFLPDRKFRLNVAIRTLLFEQDRIETGIGGGIVYDSTPEDEWREALLKCRYATVDEPVFSVFETLLWTPREGFLFQKEHIQRAVTSQRYFGRPYRVDSLETELARLQTELERESLYRNGACVKVQLTRNGALQTIVTPPRLPDWRITPLKVLVSASQVQSSDVFLYHKTTHRSFFDDCLHKAREKGFHEVVFLNEREELTQGSISNIFLRKRGTWVTPAGECGLLAGIWRGQTIVDLNAKEKHLTLDELFNSDEVILGNSLRGRGTVADVVIE